MGLVPSPGSGCRRHFPDRRALRGVSHHDRGRTGSGDLGKRRAGLTLDDPEGSITFGQVLVRNAVKVLPWQFGHMSAMRFAVGDAPMGFSVLLLVASLVLLAAVVLPVLVGRIGLHDRVAGTTVRARVATLNG